MYDYEEKMLILLVEKYRKSKKDSGTARTNRRTKIKPTELYKAYDRNDGDLEKINAVNELAEKYVKKGYLTYEKKPFSNEISAIYLIDEQIETVEEYLAEHYHYESKHEKMRQVAEIISKYQGHSLIADQECRKLQRNLDNNTVPRDYKHAEEILKALIFIEKNQTPLYLREASMMIYGSSKYLEENTLEEVCRIIRNYLRKPCEENELSDEILEQYFIVKEKQKICMKGNISIVKDGKMIELGGFQSGIEFYTDELEKIEKIMIHDERLITVENKTSYMRCQKPGTAYFYLGGYANRYQRECLKKIYCDNPEIEYLHFGDIDAGGFYIHENLCRITGILFGLYKMSKHELEDERYKTCLLELSGNDRRRLKALAKDERYQETAEYMLERGVKLEQEIVSYWEKLSEIKE